MTGIRNLFRQIKNYPSAVAGLAIIIFLVVLALYALITIPYSEAVRLWRGGDNVWMETPRNARPAWFNYFTKKKTRNNRSKNNRRTASKDRCRPGRRGIHLRYDIGI